MINLDTQKKILFLVITQTGALDKVLAERVGPEHFVDINESKESKILSKIFKLVCDYYISSSGSLVTNEVFTNIINNSQIKPGLKTEIIETWLEIKKFPTDQNDLHFLVQELKENRASMLLDDAISKLQTNLSEKDLKEAVISLQSDLDTVTYEFESIDTERTNFDILKRADAFAKEYMHRLNNIDSFKGIPCGIPDIDEQTLGWYPGQLVVFVAPTSGGKSVQLLNCAINANRMADKKVLYFSFEMDAYHCELRTISNMLNIPYWKLKSHTLTDYEFNKMIDDYNSISGAYFEYDVNINDPTPEYIESRIRELINTKGKPDIIIADYIGNMTTRKTRKGATYWERAGDAAEGLFRLAKTYKVPILTAQQINRESVRENRKRRDEGKAAAMYQDIMSGDQRLAHLSWYVIGMEPDRNNNITIYHPVKMRDAWFEPCVAVVDPGLSKVFPLSADDQRHWKMLKGMIKPEDEAQAKIKQTSERIYDTNDEDEEDPIPWI